MKKLKKQIWISRSIFEANNIKEKISINHKKSLEEEFWKDKILAQKIIKETNFLEGIYKSYLNSENEISNIKDLMLEELKKTGQELHLGSEAYKKLKDIASEYGFGEALYKSIVHSLRGQLKTSQE